MKHLICSKCQDYFNVKDRQPLLLPTCGHSICTKCLSQMIEDNPTEVICPEDNEACEFYNPKKGIKSFPINRAIQKFLMKQSESKEAVDKEEFLTDHQEDSLMEDEICQEHNLNRNLICFTEKKLICSDCALFGDHKDHQFMKMTEYRQEISDRFTKFQTEMDQMENNKFLNKSLDKIMMEQHQTTSDFLENGIKSVFIEIRAQIDQQEKYLMESVKETLKPLKGNQQEIIEGGKSLVYKKKKLIREAEMIKKNLQQGTQNTFLIKKILLTENIFSQLQQLQEQLKLLQTKSNQIFENKLESYKIKGEIDMLKEFLQKNFIIQEEFPLEQGKANSKSFLHNYSNDTTLLKSNQKNNPIKNKDILMNDQLSSICISPRQIPKKQKTLSQDTSKNSLLCDEDGNFSDDNSQIDLDGSYYKETKKLQTLIEGKEEDPESSPFVRKKIVDLNQKQLSSMNRKSRLIQPQTPKTGQKKENFFPQEFSMNQYSSGKHIRQKSFMNQNKSLKPKNKVSLGQQFFNHLIDNKVQQFGVPQTPNFKRNFYGETHAYKYPSFNQNVLEVPFYPTNNKTSNEKVRYENINLTDEKIPQILKVIEKRVDATTLILNNNQMTTKGIKSLLNNLHGSGIEKLYIKNNQVDTQVLKYIEQHFKNTTNLRYINLEGNQVSKNAESAKLKKSLKVKGISLVI